MDFQLCLYVPETGNKPPRSKTMRDCTYHFSHTVAGGTMLHVVLQGHTSILQQPVDRIQLALIINKIKIVPKLV